MKQRDLEISFKRVVGRQPGGRVQPALRRFLEIADDEAGWEVWTKVVARRDIEERLMRPWTARAHKAGEGS